MENVGQPGRSRGAKGPALWGGELGRFWGFVLRPSTIVKDRAQFKAAS